MVSSPSTVGVKRRMIPNFFHSTETCPRELASGMGISPPARKRASWPESVTSVGSASTLAMPFCSSRFSMALKGKVGLPEKKSEKALANWFAGTSGLRVVPVPGTAAVVAVVLPESTPRNEPGELREPNMPPAYLPSLVRWNTLRPRSGPPAS